MAHREPPQIRWTAVLWGGAVALVTAVVLLYALGPGLGTVAAFLAVAAGGLVAGRLAPGAGSLHGGLVAVFWIVAEALSDPFFATAPNVLGDAASTVVADVLRLAIGVGSGWAGARLGGRR